MAINGTHFVGQTGATDDDNLRDEAIILMQAQIAGFVVGSFPNATNSVIGGVQLTNDLGGSASAPTVINSHFLDPLPEAQGGTGANTAPYVKLTGNQTKAGTLTFSSSPIVPTTPASSAAAVAKSYVDALVSTTSVIDVTKAPYNADKTGATNASGAIQDALDAVDGVGGSVYVPAGIYKIATKLQMTMRARLFGDGHWSSRLVAAAGLNDHVLENTISVDGSAANAEFTIVEDLYIDGNASNQSSGTYYGLHHDMNPQYDWAPSSGPPFSDIEFDPHHIVRNVMITNTKSDGYHGEGRSESYLDRVFAFKCGRYGIRPSFDTFLNHCTAAWSASNGFDVPDSSVRGVGCKSFYNGQTTVGGSDGHGFFFHNGQGGINFTAFEAQDNAGAGVALNNCQRSYLQGICDSNSSGHINGSVSAGSYPAVDVWSSFDNKLDIVAYERKAYGTSYQIYGLQIRQNSTGNRISLRHSATYYNGATIGAAVMTTSNAQWGNTLEINGATTEGTQSVAYASTITPNPYAGSTVVIGALTGNITVNDPATDNRHLGCKMTLCFLQDGTGGHTVTLGSGYSPGSWAVNTTANQPSALTVMWNGTKWQRVDG